jgi:hypothetical protein
MGTVICLNCGHNANQHNLRTDRHCRVRILTDWDRSEEKYAGFRACGCENYRGVDPAHACPCEYVPTSPGCVHCGKTRVR